MTDPSTPLRSAQDATVKHTGWMSYANGKRYELVMQEILTQRYPDSKIIYCAGDDPKAVDYEIEGVMIEIKGSKRRVIGKHRKAFQFLIQSCAKGPHTPSDVTLLLCVDHADDMAVFVIPSARIADCKCITISSEPRRYAGKYAPYLECWEYLDDCIKSARSDMANESELHFGDTVYNKYFGIGVIQQIRNVGHGYEYWVKFERTAIWMRADELKVEQSAKETTR